MIELNVDGATYRLRPMSSRLVQQLLDEAKAILPDPVDEVLATAAKLPDGVKDRFLDRHLDVAFEAKKLRGTLEVQDFHTWLRSTSGVFRMFQLLMHQDYPHLKTEDVDALLVKWIDQEQTDAETKAQAALTQAVKVPMTEGEVEAKFFRPPTEPDAPACDL